MYIFLTIKELRFLLWGMKFLIRHRTRLLNRLGKSEQILTSEGHRMYCNSIGELNDLKYLYSKLEQKHDEVNNER